MKVLDLQLSAYDFIGILLPGTIVLAQIGVGIYGVSDFWLRATHITTYGAILLGMAAFGLGHLINQAAHQAIHTAAWIVKKAGKSFKKFHHLNPKRVLRQARDAYWGNSDTRKLVCSTLNKACKADIVADLNDNHTCDKAYNLSLELIGNSFAKRAVFVLVAELSLSFWLLSLTAIIPLTLVLLESLSSKYHNDALTTQMHIQHYLLGLLTCAVGASLAWQRVLDFEAYADTTVFDILLAVGAIHPDDFKTTPASDSDD